jgi:protein-S-isoprenylcysteine O-methyltransferase Ste14
VAFIPALEIGLWNAWIIQVVFFLIMMIPHIFISKDSKERTKRATESIPFSKINRRLSLSTHIVIMPLVLLFSIFVPLKLGTAWFYVSLPILIIAAVVTILTSFNFASTPQDQPVTKGIYSISRHPIYVGAFFLFLGASIATASWIFLILALAWIIIWRIVVPAEESFLLERYGDAYREYMNRTPRWIGIPKS